MNAKDYKHAAPRPPRAPVVQGSWMSFITGLGLGLLVALGVYLWSAQVPVPAAVVDDPPLKVETVPAASQLPAVDAGDNGLEPPRPKFDFYKILPEMEVPVQEWELAEDADKTGPSVDAGTYVLQVGSYKAFEEADQAKAKLALQGIAATIQRVVIKGQDVWFRVHVGPLSDPDQLRATRLKLIENNTDFIVLRIGGPGTP